MRMLDLFSGIGGFSLAAQWCWGDELEIVAFCEIDKFCQKVLKKYWPNVPIIEDVRYVTAETLENAACQRWRGWCDEIHRGGECTLQIERHGSLPISTQTIDLLTGGFPCQPFSVAGKRKGKEDNRFLWPEMFTVIKEIRPRWVVAENVAGIVRMALDDCLSDLEGEDYSAQAIIIPACAVNAPHRRDRVWIVANDESTRQLRKKQLENDSEGKRNGRSTNDINSQSEIRTGWWSTEPDVGRVAHGIPSRVDRLKSLGNAIVPQVAYQIFRGIKTIEESQCLTTN